MWNEPGAAEYVAFHVMLVVKPAGRSRPPRRRGRLAVHVARVHAVSGPMLAHLDPMTLPNLATTITPPGGILGIDTDAWQARIGGSHMAALAVADLAVLMIQPTGMELQRAASVSTAFQAMTAMGMALPPLIVDLTRTNPSAASLRETMQNLREAGETVLDGTLLNSDARGGYAQAFGKAPKVTDGDLMALTADLVLREAVREQA